MIEFNTKTLMLAGLGFGVLLNIPAAISGMSNQVNVKAENAVSNADRGAAKRNARQLQKDSKAALEMAKAGCITVVDTLTQKPLPLGEDTGIVFPDGTGRYMPPGILVCNSYGFAAETVQVFDEETGEAMTIATNVMQVSPADKPIFDCYRLAYTESSPVTNCEVLEEAMKQKT